MATDGVTSASFPIVGVGASAGGLRAFTELLEALPRDTGMGFVLVQHLDPEHESALSQILSRATSLSVREIANDEKVLPNHVYVIPPSASLSIERGVLKLRPRRTTPQPHRPIDTFFESLAADRGPQAVGVVLSGTASDGTLGLEAIKAEGGITFAQDDSAKFDSMPRSAVAAGCVDLVLSPAAIAKELGSIAKHPYVSGAPGVAAGTGGLPERKVGAGRAHAKPERRSDRDDEPGGGPVADGPGERSYRKILLLLRNHSGVDFSSYKSTTLRRRINRRMVLRGLRELDAYTTLLRGNAKELDALYSDVLIGVTSFFRNPETFEILEREIVPRLVKQRGADPLRCWVLGCSTGQEAYSLAMIIKEAVDKESRARPIQIFATDLNEALLDRARHGLYPKSIEGEVSPQRLRRFFLAEEGGYRVIKPLRETVVFARQNLISDAPFSRMDLISCRNLLIYLEPVLQRRAISAFHYALKPGGFLVLGASESVGGFGELFDPVDSKHKIYAKKPAHTPMLGLTASKQAAQRHVPSAPPTPRLAEADASRAEIVAQRAADRFSVAEFAPPGVLVNASLRVVQFRGATDAFLEPPSGKASFDVLRMARHGLMLPLRTAINRAKKSSKTARVDNVRFERNGKVRAVNLEVVPLKHLPERCFLILFRDVEKVAARSASEEPRKARNRVSRQRPGRVSELEAELSETREYLQSMQEQHDAAVEEAQSASEEVQSANEELQSINEELETSKEELESANEELTTLNEEMANRNVELGRLNADLVNFQRSAQVAMVLVGPDLTIRRFSPQAAKELALISAHVGQPITAIRHGLCEVRSVSKGRPGEPAPVPSLLDLGEVVAEVVADLRERELEVLDGSGRFHSLRVRPYLTLDNTVDGAVLLLLDVDALKRSELAAAAARDYADSTVDAVREPLLVLDEQFRIETANRSFHRTFQVAPADTIGRSLRELAGGQWNIPGLHALLEDVASQRSGVEDVEIEHDFDKLGRRTLLVSARLIRDWPRERQRILLAIEDVTERKLAATARATLAAIVDSSNDAIMSNTLDGTITSFNRAAERMFGYTAEEAVGKPISLIIPVERRSEQESVLAHIRSGRRVEHFETERQHKDGSRLSVSLTVSPILGASGQIVGASEVARDITEQKRAEEALRESELLRRYSTELADAARRRHEFVAMLGHELRNPLSALALGVDLLEKMGGDGERAEDIRAMIGRQARRMSALLDQLLDIARVTSGKIELSNERVDLTEVVRAAVETVRPLIDGQRHELSLAVPSGKGVFVMGDANRLAQVVENLLTNAAKYTDRGGRIALSLESDEVNARIVVRDNGIGMGPDLLPHVFEVFTQAPRALDRAQGGLGLGLPLVQRLVELHGGSVEAASAGVGQGSQFMVTLPLALETRSKERAAGSAPVEPRRVRARRILVVDDREDVAQMLAALLAAGGHQTRAARSSAEALQEVATFDPDVALLDLGLPGTDGYELARRIRAQPSGRRILLIAVSGYQRDADRLKEAGFDEHLLKPPDMRKLAILLDAWDGKKKPSRVSSGSRVPGGE